MKNKINTMAVLGMLLTVVVFFSIRTFIFKTDKNQIEEKKNDSLFYWGNEVRNIMVELEKNKNKGYIYTENDVKIKSDSIFLLKKNSQIYAKGKFNSFYQDTLTLRLKNESLTFLKEF